MVGSFEEFHEELRAVARDVLAKTGVGEAVDRSTMAASGWPGLEVPVEHGGSGATFAEVAVVLEEMGRAVTQSPYPATAAVALGLLERVEATAASAALVSAVASGEVVPATAGAVDPEAAGGARPRHGGFGLEGSPGGFRLHGAAAFVPDAAQADRMLIVAATADGPVVVDLDSHRDAVAVVDQPVLDATRRFARVTAEGVGVDDEHVWRFVGEPDVALDRLADRAAVALACDSLGLAEAMLEATVAYAADRHQFGRPIGSFQAVKHACADMAVAVALSRELVDVAVAAIVADEADAWVGASMAKSQVTAAAVDVAGSAMQLHGGIGYTWESGIHAYLKRAVLNRSLHGSPADHRRRLATRYPR